MSSKLGLLFASPEKILKHPKLRKIWGQELPHVIKEIYHSHQVFYSSKSVKKILSFWNWIRLIRATQLYRSGMPYEYVWGHSKFRGRDFLINRSALIPRPETEEWVGQVIKNIQNNFNKKVNILEIGTGSGVIAITIKAECSDANVTAVEISSSALRLAKKNARRLLKNSIMEGTIHFLHGDIFQIPIKKILLKLDHFDIVLTNPPYIGWEEKHTLPPQVVQYEPHIALFAENNGIDFYRKLAYLIPSLLNYQNFKGYFYTEIGWKQAEKVKKIFHYFQKKEIVKDMFGKERLFIGQNIKK